jgi:hypothetical protein
MATPMLGWRCFEKIKEGLERNSLFLDRAQKPFNVPDNGLGIAHPPPMILAFQFNKVTPR